jgi:hypothetical protein
MVMSTIRPKLRRQLLQGEEPEWLAKHTRRERVIAAAMSAPPWVRPADFKEFAKRAAWLTTVTGVKHVIDHIVPVSHPLVCGLTVPWNMQVIDEGLNQRKGNKLHLSFQAEMFSEPEQLRML